MVLFGIFGQLGVGKCVSKDTLVLYLNDGSPKITTIKEVFVNRHIISPKALSFNFNESKYELNEVKYIYTAPEPKLIKIETRCGRILKVTKTHKLPIIDSNGNFVLREAEKIKPGDYLIVPGKLDVNLKKGSNLGINAYIMGLWVADGNRTTISQKNKEIVDFLCSLGLKYRKGRRGVKIFNVGHIISKFVSTSTISKLKSDSVDVPSVVMEYEEDLKYFIGGYFDGDGWIEMSRDNKMVYFYFLSKSDVLISKISYILLFFGIPTYISRLKKKYKGKYFIYNLLVIPNPYTKIFYDTFKNYSVKLRSINESVFDYVKDWNKQILISVPTSISKKLYTLISLIRPYKKEKINYFEGFIKNKWFERIEHLSDLYHRIGYRKKYEVTSWEVIKRDLEIAEELLKFQKSNLEVIKSPDGISRERIYIALESLPFKIEDKDKIRFVRNCRIDQWVVEKFEEILNSAEKMYKELSIMKYFYTDKIKNVTEIDYNDNVYDFVNLKNHMFIGGNLPTILHNTLSAVALTFKNWFYRGMKVYSNIPLYRIPYIWIRGINQFTQIKGYDWLICDHCSDHGRPVLKQVDFKDEITAVTSRVKCPKCGNYMRPAGAAVLADELWFVVDARSTLKKRNQLMSAILLRSRKLDVHYFFTAQMIDQLDKRIRKVIDFSAVPIMNPQMTVAKLLIFMGSHIKRGTPPMHTIYFKTRPVFEMYNTKIDPSFVMVEEWDKEPPIIFQPDKYNPNEIYTFKTWEEADRFATRWWEKELKKRAEEILPM